MQRISIIGSGGSGKSTLAKQLGEKLDIPVHHLDALFWQPGWKETEREDWADIQKSLCKDESWIMDGNYGGTIDIRLEASDTIILLDLNRFLCIYRAISRWYKYRNKTRPDMAQGCDEKIDLEFLKWIFNYPKYSRPKILQKFSQLDDKTNLIILNTPKKVETFLKNIDSV